MCLHSDLQAEGHTFDTQVTRVIFVVPVGKTLHEQFLRRSCYLFAIVIWFKKKMQQLKESSIKIGYKKNKFDFMKLKKRNLYVFC